MRYCDKCGKHFSEDNNYCPICGNALRNLEIPGTNDNITESDINKKKIYWEFLFEEIFCRHRMQEMEKFMICGTDTTTPTPDSIPRQWPHPWLYSRVFLLFFITFCVLSVCVWGFENRNTIPSMIVMGSFAIPLTTMILFMEINVWRNISIYAVIITFFVGGCTSILASLIISRFIGNGYLDYIGALTVGTTEEIAKAIIVYFFFKRFGKISILSGMLIGASIGAGFASFEEAGYALQPFLYCDGEEGILHFAIDNQLLVDSAEILFVRAIFSPGGHVTWTALIAAGMAMAPRSIGADSWHVFFHKRFLLLLATAILFHTVWDSPLITESVLPDLGYISLEFLVWLVTLSLIRQGMKEVWYRVAPINPTGIQKYM